MATTEPLPPIYPLPTVRTYYTSHIEDRVYAALDSLDIPYERQREFNWYRVDVHVPSLRLVIECDGCEVHACPTCYPDPAELTPYGILPAAVRRKQLKRDTYLRMGFNLRVIHLWGHELETAEQAYHAVRAVLIAARERTPL